MLLESFQTYKSNVYNTKYATESWEKNEAFALRRRVFCKEQGIFSEDDQDSIDHHAQTIVTLSSACGMPSDVVGTVRIHKEQDNTWYGSRLAVDPLFRKVGSLGKALIYVAVSSAHYLGCQRFLAYVQSQNVVLFKRLRWMPIEEIVLHEKTHWLMQANLNYYPPLNTGTLGYQVHPKR